jgi:hypothetical protein
MFKLIRKHAKVRIDQESEKMQEERRKCLILTSP